MQKHAIHLLLYIVCGMLAVAGCSRHPGEQQYRPQPSDSLYTGQAALNIYHNDPDRALAIIDSAEIVGHLTDFDADILRAVVYSHSELELRHDTARQICEALLRHDSITSNPRKHGEVLDMLVYISLHHDNEEGLRWATAKAQLYWQQGDETEALRTEADIGIMLAKLGRPDEGLAKLDLVISQLEKGAPSMSRLDATIVALKRKINVLNMADSHADVIRQAQHIVRLIDNYEQHPDAYAEDAYRLPHNTADRRRYCQFYRMQAIAFMAEAYALEGDHAKARHYLSIYESSDMAHTPDAQLLILPTLRALRLYDKVLRTCNELERKMEAEGDTLRDVYCVVLHDHALAANALGLHAAAFSHMQRHASLTKQLCDQQLASKAHEYAARYHAQEQQMEIEHQQAAADLFKLYATAGAVVALLSIGFAVWFFRQKHIVNRKNHVLVEQIAEAIAYKNKYEALKEQWQAAGKQQAREKNPLAATPEADSPAAAAEAPRADAPAAEPDLETMDNDQLFSHLRDVIKRERLFTDPNFDRQAAISYFHLSKNRLGAAFAQGSDYTSLSSFIRDCRLEYACDLLLRSDMPVGDIATTCGFSRITTFNHDFKAKYDVSPSLYRQQLRQP